MLKHILYQVIYLFIFGFFLLLIVVPTKTHAMNTPSPVGTLDNATCEKIEGWACDSANPNTPIAVHIYKKASYFDGGTIIGATTADISREAAVGNFCGGTSAHGYLFTVPSGALETGDKIFVHAITGNNNPVVWNSGKTVTCAGSAPAAQATPTVTANSTPTPLPVTVTVTATPTPARSVQQPQSPTPTAIPTCQDPSPSLGTIDLPLSTTQTGAYTIWVRMMTAGDSANSVYAKVGDDCAVAIGDKTGMPANSWIWVNYKNGNDQDVFTTDLSQGDHFIKLIGKEPGVKVDKLMALNNGCIPTGDGSNCTSLLLNPAVTDESSFNPIGNHDGNTCQTITGWTCDKDNYAGSVDVHFYKNLSYFDGGTMIGATTANLPREAAVGNFCGGTTTHGFSFTPPSGSVQAGDKIYIHAINVGKGTTNPLLWNTGKVITCENAVIPTPTTATGVTTPLPTATPIIQASSAPSITSANLNNLTSKILSVTGTNLTYPFVLRVYPLDVSIQKGPSLAPANYDGSTFATFRLSSDNLSNACNTGGACTFYVDILSTTTNAASPRFKVVIQ